jgi:hypothetical protein
MAFSQPPEGAMQGVQVGVSGNGDRSGEVIGNSLWSHFVEEP